MSKYSQHQDFLKKVLLELQDEFKDARFFQSHVGMFNTMQGKPVRLGVKGEADIYGLLKSPYGLIYLQIEIKTGNAIQNKDQKIWEKFIKSMNGVYIVVTDKKETRKQIRGIYEQIKRVILK